MGFHPESFARFKMMRQLLPGISIPKECISDFLTTICNPQGQHLPFSRMPVRGVGNEWARGTFTDSPHMSCGSRLKFCSNIPAQHYITSFPLEGLLRHTEGTVFLDANGKLVGARCSSSLSAKISTKLYNIYRWMEMYWPFLLRGVDAEEHQEMITGTV